MALDWAKEDKDKLFLSICAFALVAWLVGLYCFCKMENSDENQAKKLEQEEEKKSEEKSELLEDTKTSEPKIEEQKQTKGGASFKKLKQMSKKKSKGKGGAGPDPSHEAYLCALKGIQSTLIDVDFIETPHWLFCLVAEESSQISAYAIDRSGNNQPCVIQKSNRLDGGLKLTSASMSLLQATSTASQSISSAEEKSLPHRFIVATSCFDHCMVKVFHLTFHRQAFEFSPVQNVLLNCHQTPVGKIRLSKKFPRLLVTCGYEKDVWIKLWNVSAKTQEEGAPAKCLHQLSTSQLKHKQMAQMVEQDVYAVAASTSEIKLFQIQTGGGKGPQAGSTQLSKAQTLIEHRKEAIAVAFDHDLCVSVASDNKAIVHRVSTTTQSTRQNKVLLTQSFSESESPVSEHSLVAIRKVEPLSSSEREQVYYAISDQTGGIKVWHLILDARGESVQSGPTQVLHIESAHNSELVNSMQFVSFSSDAGETSYLATGAGLDQRVNFWRI